MLDRLQARLHVTHSRFTFNIFNYIYYFRSNIKQYAKCQGLLCGHLFILISATCSQFMQCCYKTTSTVCAMQIKTILYNILFLVFTYLTQYVANFAYRVSPETGYKRIARNTRNLPFDLPVYLEMRDMQYLQLAIFKEHICRSRGYNFRFIGQASVSEILKQIILKSLYDQW